MAEGYDKGAEAFYNHVAHLDAEWADLIRADTPNPFKETPNA